MKPVPSVVSFRFGPRTYTELSRRWNSETHEAEVRFSDDTGREFDAIGWGMFDDEIKQAMLDGVYAEAKRALTAKFEHPATCPCADCT